MAEMYDLRAKFLKQEGKAETGIYPISQYKIPREAAANEDFGAFTDWKRGFVTTHGEEKARSRFRESLRRMDPVPRGRADAHKFEQEFLTTKQRGTLQAARQYTAELRDLLVVWWATSDQQLQTDVVDSLVYTIVNVKSPDEIQQAEIDKSVAIISRMGISANTATEILMRRMRKNSNRVDTRRLWRSRLLRRLGNQVADEKADGD